ncbi:serine hydrolase domain-containing protein [Marinicella sp. W31]|uniref:serine hydrolase domain-containing protein n=1 Tax=Marinicella sp. W31 TaxID=3023713 RepID=UPI00375785F9
MKHLSLPKAYLCLLTLLCLTGVNADANKDIDTYLSDFIKQYNIAGLQISVFDSNSRIFEKNYGAANPAKKVSLQSNTLMFTASISKLITTELITKMAAEKKLQLNQSIGTYLPHLLTLSDQFNNISIQHLLTHTSGLNDDSFSFPFFKTTLKGRKSIGILQRINSAEKVTFAAMPGEQWLYSDINFDLLGAVIEQLNNTDFASAAKDAFFQPLTMRYSGYDRERMSGFIFANSYKKRKRLPGKSEKDVYNPPYVNASNGLFSCVYDLVLWSQYQFKHSSRYIAWNTQYSINDSQQMGLGWRIKQFEGHKVVYHYAGYKGYRHKLALFPGLKKGIIILSNDANMDELRDVVFEELSRAFIVTKP